MVRNGITQPRLRSPKARPNAPVSLRTGANGRSALRAIPYDVASWPGRPAHGGAWRFGVAGGDVLSVLVLTLTAFLALLPLAATRSGRAAALAGRLAAPARTLPRYAFALACAAALLLALVQILVVVLVQVFAVSVVWLQELTQYLFGAMILLASGGVLLADGHVRVDVLYGRWAPRTQALVNLLGLTLLVLPVCALVVLSSAPYVAASWAELERSAEPTGLHATYLLKSLIPAFGFLLGLAAFASASDAAAIVRERS